MLTIVEKLNDLLPDVGNAELFSQLFDDFPEGVMVLDIHTVLLYYNKAQGLIDELAPEQAAGQTILDLYRVADNTSYPSLRCLFSRKPLLNHACYYYTHLGKLVNSIHNVFPLMTNGVLAGCICFIREYGQLMHQYDVATDNISKSTNDNGGRKSGYTFDQIITRDPMMRKSLDIAGRAADTPSPIMIYGPTGCGKEMVAQAIHNKSVRRQKSFVAVNCAAIPESLLEGILFGTTKGAFTGALDKPGLMELADGGTIFLDEINSMPLGLQSKMLRALQEQRIRRVGDSRERAVSLKIISASNVHPQKAVTNGSLRADLFFRLGVVTVTIPPLRVRLADIAVLTQHFIKKLNHSLQKNVTGISREMEKFFQRHQWPGNVRELEHALEGAMNLVREHETILMPEHFNSFMMTGDWEGLKNGTMTPEPHGQPYPARPEPAARKIDELDERDVLAKALTEHNGVAARAARSLGLSPQLMHYKIKKYDLKKKIIIDDD